MDSYEELMEKGRQYNKYRNRHDSHVVGDKLYYYCKDLQDYRPGTVYATIEHEGMKHYVLEVSCHIGEFLVLQSQYQIRVKEELIRE